MSVFRKKRFSRQLFITLLAICMAVSAVQVLFQFIDGKTKDAKAADVAIDTNVSGTSTSFNGTAPTVVFVSDTNGYAFYRDSGGNCVYSKTTNRGVSWGAAIQVDGTNTTDCIRIAVWYDQWTPGDTTGTYIHIATIDSGADDSYYTRLDTSSDTLSTTVLATTQAASLAAGTNMHSITKGTNGNIYIAVSDSTDQWVVRCTANCTVAASWAEIANPFDATNDWAVLVPLAGGNIMLIRRDLSADDYDSRIWTGAAWSASWVSIDTTGGENTTYDGPFGATVNKDNNDVYFTYTADNSTLGTDDDVRVAIYDGANWNLKSAVLTNDTKGIMNAKISRDQNNGDIYVLYTARTTPGTASTANVYYKKSTDGMNSWGTETQINDTSDDIYGANMNIMGTHRIYATWLRVSLADLYGETVATLTPPLLTQKAYRWFNNTNSTDVGSALANTNASATAPPQGTPFRLRMIMSVASGSLDISSKNFKLQVASKSGTCDTAFSGETYADVQTGSGEIRFSDNSTPTDGTALTANGSDPTDGGLTIWNQTYEESNNFTNSISSIPAGDDGKWDFSLVDSTATAGKTFCFRMVKSDGNLLDVYSKIPQVITRATSAATTQVSSTGTQTANMFIPSTKQYLGGRFVITSTSGARNVTGVTISEKGTVNGSSNVASVSLFYDLDTTSPYDCASESYASTDTKFGSTDVNGFSSADGTSAFSGTAAISTVSAMCVYPVVDILSGAANGETLDIEVASPSTDVTVSAGSVGPTERIVINDVTTLLAGVDLQQAHYRWRNDDGTETGFNTGSGADGSATIATTRNINTAVLGSNRTVNADGILTTVSAFSAAASGTSVTVASITGIAQGDEVFLANLQGDTTNYGNAGTYEFLTVQSVGGNTVTFTSAVRKIYGATNSNSTLTGQKIILQRVPQWTNVTINSGGKLTANDWDGTSGGVIVFRATGTVTVNSGGSIFADGLGYRGGSLDTSDTVQASFRAEGQGGNRDNRSQSENIGGGGGGYTDTNASGATCLGGAGRGGYGATGGTATQTCGARNGAGGASYGLANLTKLYLGGGGGAGGHDTSPTTNSGGPGGDGGGIIMIAANTISVSGSGEVTSGGETGSPGEGTIWIGGAGGAGGSVMLQAISATLGTNVVTADGGIDGGSLGLSGYVSGTGSVGRIRVESDTISGTTSPTASTVSTPMNGGATWAAAEDTQLDNLTKNVTRRVRFEISNEGGQTSSGASYRLEVSGANPSSCVAATYTRLDTETSWDVVSSTYFTDAASTSNIIPGLTDANPTFRAGQIKESNDQTASMNLTGTQFTELEYAVQATSNASDGAVYCFRLTNAGSTTNFTYFESKYAKVSLSGGPSISNFLLNAGDPISLVEGTTASVSATATITDVNGYADIVQATTAFSIYRSGIGYNCAANQNNCYRPTCDYSGCSGNSCTVTCTASVQFFAEPTDIGTYSAENWVARIKVWDTTDQSSSATALGVELETLYALGLSTSTINYGALDPSQDTGSVNKKVQLTNSGNATLNPQVSGTDMTGPGTLAVSQQKFAKIASFSYSSFGTALSTSAQATGLTLTKPTSTVASASTTYWGIGLPSVLSTGLYNGTNTFDAVP